MTQKTSNPRAASFMLLSLAGGSCLMMFTFLAANTLGIPTGRTNFSFWLFTGLTVAFSVAAGWFRR